MNVFEIIEELSKKSKDEIQYALLSSLLSDKIDFVDLSAAYVECLNHVKEDRLNQLVEAEICVCESLLYDKFPKKKAVQDSIQRRLYLMNQSNRFNMTSLNEKFSYDEEKAKELSWYYRNKK